jgi:hypothetical protein
MAGTRSRAIRRRASQEDRKGGVTDEKRLARAASNAASLVPSFFMQSRLAWRLSVSVPLGDDEAKTDRPAQPHGFTVNPSVIASLAWF